MSPEHRVKIQNSNILNALVEHVEGRREMTPTQVTAGIALLKKVLPDLQSVQISGDADNPIEHRHEDSTARELIASRIIGIAARVGPTKNTERLN